MTFEAVPAQTTIDVRQIPPNGRHTLIIDTFDKLLPDQILMVISDHDPEPLRRGLAWRYGERVRAEYVESGPEVWRVRFGKRLIESCCGGNCGG